MTKLKLATVFSGIGAVEHALERLKIPYDIVFASDNGEIQLSKSKEEIITDMINMSDFEKQKYINDLYLKTRKTNYVEKTYFANYDIDKENFHQDVRFIDGYQYRGDVDLFVGGSPCQSFSMVGKRGGFDDTRGTLFYEYARLVKEIQPKVFIYENVRNILNHDGGNTWAIMSNVFTELGYDWKYQLINASDHGVPQTRNRIYVVGIRKDLTYDEFFFPDPIPLKKSMKEYLEKDIPTKYYLSDKMVNYVMASGTKGFYSRPQIDLDVARPLLSTMTKMHRAGVDNYVTTNGKIRKLTPRECLRLMGFKDSFKIVVSDAQAYKQAGNSIVVDVLMRIIQELINTNVWKDIVFNQVA